jgi:hypothetical protein
MEAQRGLLTLGLVVVGVLLLVSSIWTAGNGPSRRPRAPRGFELTVKKDHHHHRQHARR